MWARVAVPQYLDATAARRCMQSMDVFGHPARIYGLRIHGCACESDCIQRHGAVQGRRQEIGHDSDSWGCDMSRTACARGRFTRRSMTRTRSSPVNRSAQVPDGTTRIYSSSRWSQAAAGLDGATYSSRRETR